MTYSNQNDKGSNGKNAEVAVRKAITPATKIDYCKSLGLVDHTMKINGRMAKLEIKTGSGTVLYNVERTEKAEDYLQKIVPGVDYVIYGKEWTADTDIMQEFVVFTRDEFISFLGGYNKSLLKFTNKGGATCVNIQTWSENSKPKQNYLWNALLNQPTLGEFLEQVRG